MTAELSTATDKASVRYRLKTQVDRRRLGSTRACTPPRELRSPLGSGEARASCRGKSDDRREYGSPTGSVDTSPNRSALVGCRRLGGGRLSLTECAARPGRMP